GDLSRAWTPEHLKSQNDALKMGTNIVLYASGRTDLRNRSVSLDPGVPDVTPLAAVPIARVRYAGNWDPEPGAWPRMAKIVRLGTNLHCDVRPVAAASLDVHRTPIAHLTGTDAIQLSSNEIAAITRFVDDGGVLLIDVCGGSKAFGESVQKQLIDPMGIAEVLAGGSPLFDASAPGMLPLDKPRLRSFSQTQKLTASDHLLHVHHGQGDIIFTPLDLTSGFLGTNTWGISGFEPAHAQAIVQNVIVWAARQSARIAPTSEPTTTPTTMPILQ
ncbi:MAG: DUF4159 domain-containing protein, partial [Phycisphaerae bacterium]|nr:DUF4159 domain-containing protein [Phycisphaerae bacterium]